MAMTGKIFFLSLQPLSIIHGVLLGTEVNLSSFFLAQHDPVTDICCILLIER